MVIRPGELTSAPSSSIQSTQSGIYQHPSQPFTTGQPENDVMSALSVNSISNNYVHLSVARQRVAIDRANVIESENALRQDEAQLDKDLTYLATVQRKTNSVEKLETSQAQENAQGRVEVKAEAAQKASQQAIALLATFGISENSGIGSNINTVA